MPQRADVLSATLTPEQARCVCAVPADQPRSVAVMFLEQSQQICC